MRPYRIFQALLCVAVLTGCSDRGGDDGAPGTSITVLVDLSSTWHNEANRQRNQRLLDAVGNSIGSAGVAMQRSALPVSVSFLSIGDGTFLEEALCSARFKPQLVQPPGDDTFINHHRFVTYLVDECASFILELPEEPMTDITAAITSAARGQSLAQPETEIIIILSDFREERSSDFMLQQNDIEGRHFLLLYRDIGEDPAVLDDRVRDWNTRLTELGGHVLSVADTNVNDQGSSLQAYIVNTAAGRRND